MIRPTEDDLLTVGGVSHFCCEEMENLIRDNQSIGYYKALKQDYVGLKSILNILETC